MPFFRFPGFADTPELVAFLSARNIGVFGADFWGSDWLDMTPEKELALILARIEREKRGILLLHDTKQQTAAMLQRFCANLNNAATKSWRSRPGKPAADAARARRLDLGDGQDYADVFAKAHRVAKPPASPGKGCHRCRLQRAWRRPLPGEPQASPPLDMRK